MWPRDWYAEKLRRAWLALWGYRERPLEDYRGLFKAGHRMPPRTKERLFEHHDSWWPWARKGES